MHPLQNSIKILDYSQKTSFFGTRFFIQTAGLVYHHALACISSALRAVYHHWSECICPRFDAYRLRYLASFVVSDRRIANMQCSTLMIYRNKLRMICNSLWNWFNVRKSLSRRASQGNKKAPTDGIPDRCIFYFIFFFFSSDRQCHPHNRSRLRSNRIRHSRNHNLHHRLPPLWQ